MHSPITIKVGEEIRFNCLFQYNSPDRLVAELDFLENSAVRLDVFGIYTQLWREIEKLLRRLLGDDEIYLAGIRICLVGDVAVGGDFVRLLYAGHKHLDILAVVFGGVLHVIVRRSPRGGSIQAASQCGGQEEYSE